MERITQRYFAPSQAIYPRLPLNDHYNKKQAKYLYKHYFNEYKFNQVFDKVTVYSDGTIERLYTE